MVNQKAVVSAVFVAAMFMNIMDGTVVGVALPTLSRYFAVPIGSVSGVVTAYLVTLAVAMPASGWLGDRFGGRNVLLAAITCSPPPPRCAGWRPRCPSWSPSGRCRDSAAAP